MATQRAQKMQITVPDEYGEAAEKRARELGYSNLEEFVTALLKRETEHPETEGERAEGEDRGWQAVNRLRGTAKGRLTADEIMEMTRSEV